MELALSSRIILNVTILMMHHPPPQSKTSVTAVSSPLSLSPPPPGGGLSNPTSNKNVHSLNMRQNPR